MVTLEILVSSGLSEAPLLLQGYIFLLVLYRSKLS